MKFKSIYDKICPYISKNHKNYEKAPKTIDFCKKISAEYCIDISAQTYKANCPPAALTKLPIISSQKLLDFVADAMDKILIEMEREQK